MHSAELACFLYMHEHRNSTCMCMQHSPATHRSTNAELVPDCAPLQWDVTSAEGRLPHKEYCCC